MACVFPSSLSGSDLFTTKAKKHIVVPSNFHQAQTNMCVFSGAQNGPAIHATTLETVVILLSACPRLRLPIACVVRA